METSDNALREQISAAYAPLVALYQLFESRLREAPDDRPPVGWKPQLDALRALRDGKTAGDWADLTRLMVDPAALAPAPDPQDPHVLLVEAADSHAPEAVARFTERLSADRRRVLLLAPSADAAHRALAGAGRFAVLVGPDDDPPPGAAAETWVRGAGLHPLGDAYAEAWTVESRRLQRDLLWLEQWPRDKAAIAAVRAAQERQAQELTAEEARLAAEVERLRDEAATAELAAAAARKTRDGLAEELRRAEGGVAGLQEEHDVFRAQAAEAARVAAERGQVAEEAYARYAATEQRHAECVREVEAAKEREAYLVEELPKAKAALPQAEAAVAQATAVLAAAEADAHASYYRLAAAESAMAAEKQNMTVSQRLHLRPARPEAEGVRQQLAERRREADDSLSRAQQASEALDRAEAYRQSVANLIANGEQELAAVRENQQHLAQEVVRLAAERDPARAEHEEQARRAAQAVEESTDREAAARQAELRLHQGRQRLEKARTAHAEAAEATAQAEAAAATAGTAVSAATAELDRHRSEMATAEAQAAAELQAEVETEERSRRHVTAICGEDPNSVPEAVLAELRDRAMARIEELSGYLDGEVPTGVLLAQAEVVAATPAAFAAGPPAIRDAGYDTLIAVDAGRLTDGEFLVGAVHTGHWILIGSHDQAPPPPDKTYVEYLHALAELAALPETSETTVEDRPSQTNPDITRADHLAKAAPDITLEDRSSGPSEASAEDRPSNGAPRPTVENRPPSGTSGPTAEDRPSQGTRGPTIEDRKSQAAPGPTVEDRPSQGAPGPTVEDRPSQGSPDITVEDRSDAGSTGLAAKKNTTLGEGFRRPVLEGHSVDATVEDRPVLSAEAERIRRTGLWEARYQQSYEKALRRIEQLDDPAAQHDPARTLADTLDQRLRRSVFARCVEEAPALLAETSS